MRSARLATLPLAAILAVLGCGSARDLETAGGGDCTSCHGFPPPPFVTGATSHPTSTACSLCHSATVDANGNLIPGGAHLNGQVDVIGHPLPYVAEHTSAALADIGSCTACHGADYDGGITGTSCNACHAGFGFADWKTNCTFCHGTRTQGWTVAELPKAAPPEGVHGETLTSEPAVGAHQKHLGNGSTLSDGVGCSECHAVPADLTHLDGAATLTFGPLATQGGQAPQYAGGTCSSVYCHGATLNGGADTTPVWTGSVACGDCHGTPPATGRHQLQEHLGQTCYRCHSQVATNTGTPGIANNATAKGLHVNGLKDVSLSVTGTWDPVAKTCTNVACHGAGTKSW